MEGLFGKLGVHIPEILLPAKGTNLTKWSVIACDQYTSQPDYWKRVNEEVGDSPSTLRLTFPEIYLKDNDRDERISNINVAMLQYLEKGILEPQKPGFILVDRSTPHAASRKGLILAVDLECYDYAAGAQALIRATEGTVLDRIPPRVKIRENAPIELPHIMVLIDDPDKTVIEALYEEKDNFEKLYDFELMQGGGHIRGWKVDDAGSLSMAAEALARLAGMENTGDKVNTAEDEANTQEDRPKADGYRPVAYESHPEVPLCKAPLLFAMGDGNHSLASAKAHWENVKAILKHNDSENGLRDKAAKIKDTAAEIKDSAAILQTPDSSVRHIQNTATVPEHPARYALVEVVNVHDQGLVFEPIHRVLFGIDSTTVLENIKNICSCISNGKSEAEFKLYGSRAAMEAGYNTVAAQYYNKASCTTANTTPINNSTHLLSFILEGVYGLLSISNPTNSLEVGTLQSILDELEKNCPNIEIDYIHGEQVVTEIGSQKDHMGFYLPVLSKYDFFKTIKQDGIFPRKTFSLGEAEEKRYYLESRRIG
jgi:hypothetical protein